MQQRGNISKVQGVMVEYSQGRVGEQMNSSFTVKSNSMRCVVESTDATRLILDYQRGVSFRVSEPLSDMFIVSRGELTGLDLETMEMSEVGRDTMFTWGCVKYEFEQDGHSIELWATEELGFGGTFSLDYNLGESLLILKVVVDGEYVVEATSLERYTLRDESLEASLEDLL